MRLMVVQYSSDYFIPGALSECKRLRHPSVNGRDTAALPPSKPDHYESNCWRKINANAITSFTRETKDNSVATNQS